MLGRIFNVIKNEDKKLYAQNAIHETLTFGVLLAIVGGFLDAYTFVGRGGVFSNAQTGNIVLLGVYASQGQWTKALAHIPSILAFSMGVIAAEAIKNNASKFYIFEWERLVLIFETMVLFIIGFIPETIPNIVVTVAVSFAASVQVSSFRKLVDSPYFTTMSTGNLRSATQSAYIAITQKDHKSAVKSIRYFTIIFSFIFGGFMGGLLTLIIGVKSIWCAGIILVSAVILFSISKGKSVDEGCSNENN